MQTERDREIDEELVRATGKFESVGKGKGAPTFWGLQMQNKKGRTSVFTCAASVEISEKAFHVAIIEHFCPRI